MQQEDYIFYSNGENIYIIEQRYSTGYRQNVNIRIAAAENHAIGEELSGNLEHGSKIGGRIWRWRV